MSRRPKKTVMQALLDLVVHLETKAGVQPPVRRKGHDACMEATKKIIESCGRRKTLQECCESIAPRHMTSQSCSPRWKEAFLHHASKARLLFL